MSPAITAGSVFRAMLAAATAVFALLGFVLRDEPRFFVASAACGTMWLAWNVLREYVVGPLFRGAGRVWFEGSGVPRREPGTTGDADPANGKTE